MRAMHCRNMSDRPTATVTGHHDGHAIVATAEKTGDREDYGWWIGRFRVSTHGARAVEGRVPGYYISAEGALEAALGEARRVAEGGEPAGRTPGTANPGERPPV